MPRLRPPDSGWIKGELTELLEGRTTIKQYGEGAKTVENLIVLEQGAVQRRAGTRFVSIVKTPSKLTRIVRYVSSKTASYAIEFGEGYARFYRNNVRIENPPGTPVEIVTPYVASDLRLLNFSQQNDILFITCQFYAPRKLLRFSDFVWQLRFVGQASAALPFIVPPSYEYGTRPVATVTPSATTGNGITFTASVAQFQNADVGREILIINGTNIGARAIITAFTDTTHVTGDITQDFVNAAANAASDWKITESYKTTITPSAITPVGLTITLTLGVAGWRTGDVGKFVQLNGGIAEITSITTTTVVNAILRSALNTATAAQSDAWTLEENAWSSANGFPACDEFLDQRHYYGGTLAQPQTFWGSATGDFENFAVGVLDDDAVQFTINDNQLNPIVWMRGARKLLIGTTTGSFEAFGGQDRLITPTNIEVRPAASYGSTDDVQPLKVGAVVLTVTASTRKVRELVYSYEIDSYVAPDLLILSEHMTRDNGILELALQQEPTLMVHAIRDDGVLMSATYLRDLEVIAWTRQVTGNVDLDEISGHASPVDGFIESVCVIPHPNGDRDQVWLIVRRTIGGATTRYVEYFDDGHFAYRTLHTDAAKTYDGTGTVSITLAATTGTFVVTASAPFFVASDVNREIRIIGTSARATVTVFTNSTHVTVQTINNFSSVGPYAAGAWGIARSDLDGLAHLNGQTIDIVADGAPLPQQTVNAGAATATEKGIKMEAGLHYESTLVTERPEANLGGTIQGLPVRQSEVMVRLFESLGLVINDEEEVFRIEGDLNNVVPALRTDDYITKGLPGWDGNNGGRIKIQQKQPLPMTVLMLSSVLEVGQ